MLLDATDPFAVKVNGPDTVCPAGGVVKETVGAAIATFTDLDATALCLPVESTILNSNV